ncbi:hypothetical protein GX51_03870 [Blastomyces parvus]|uniref:Uncharacterized protein n=1 Tax=Blastomyces parvus TaxID=2060905 RepID=A0A2B7X3T9_9EURO|nr:hypothetical protein GX51_03870 [Blastomyces parvus]
MKAWSILGLALGVIHAAAAPGAIPRADDLDLHAPQLNGAVIVEPDNNISLASPLIRRGEPNCYTYPPPINVTGSKSTELSVAITWYCAWINGRKAKNRQSFPLEMHWHHFHSGRRMITFRLTNKMGRDVTFNQKSCTDAFGILMFGCSKRIRYQQGLFFPGGCMIHNGLEAWVDIGPQV